MRKHNKKKESQYKFWQEEFTGHRDYMVNGEEYSRIRGIIASYLVDDDSILDLGCAGGGTYEYLKRYTDWNGDYKGIDYCEKFIETNKRKHPDIKWELGDIRYLKEPEESWDVVIFYDSIDNLDGWELALSRAMKIVRDLIIIVTWKDNHPEEKAEYLEKKKFDVDHFIKTKEELGLSEHHFIIAGRNEC